jgi:hypothetical protein
LSRILRVTIVAAGLVLVGGLAPPGAEGPAVGIVVVKEHGVGSAALAQPYLDRLAALAAEQNGWSATKGQYLTSRDAATAFIEAEHPHYGILSLPVFLALRSRYDLEVIGQVTVSLAGGRQYHLISRTATELAGCKGKALASDHTDDRRFVERVVAAGSFTLGDFTLLQTQRPLQAVKKVLDGDATCALVDDAQLADLAHIEGADGVRSVWKSAELPPMPVVAFPAASRAERDGFREHLHEICSGEGKDACKEVGILSLTDAGTGDYAGVVAAYGR